MGDAVDTQHAAAHDDDSTRGRPYHDKITQDLKAMLNKRRILDRQVTMLEEAIYKKETEYLDDTPYGNILVGFENYIKGSTSSTTNPAAARRKAGLDDNNRVFSRSSTRYADNTDSPNFSSSHTTPAPTPGVEKSFGNVKGEKEDGKSGNATPTSAGGGNRKGEVVKKAAKRPVGEDSETDSGVGKKGRITLASRKGTN